MRTAFQATFFAITASAVVARDIYIQRVDAVIGDIVFFNYLLSFFLSKQQSPHGNHTATQSTFAAPCQPAHDSNSSLNGFTSPFESVANGSAPLVSSVPILEENFGAPSGSTMTHPVRAGKGAVGVINSNESSNATLAGFERNAIRLNGTATSSSASGSFTPSSTGSASSSESSSAANQLFAVSSASTIGPLAALAFGLIYL
ncbi:hypothetical protein DFH11DRAFT_1726282 [Phellopilus nigrolimitatus]|nr:hypothetical protein DFH11DRAFT_1726282 [Phellopilus nigrolimitatus]